MEKLLFQSNFAAKTGSELDDLVEAGRRLVKEYVAKNIKANDIVFHSDVNNYFFLMQSKCAVQREEFFYLTSQK